ncbi:glu S.griseus protease inhibitor-like [Mercurialis annua]|uniref:glu S.griseus protease inhibitor-like n=1 Tax=Mercurialis annua TaxID=3986 RepID=UPI0024ACA00C|nr:glu S.griseus protease inhibitor-like [Mercurialis annua]
MADYLQINIIIFCYKKAFILIYNLTIYHGKEKKLRTEVNKERCQLVKVYVYENRIAGKDLWPELVGINGEAATVKIMSENPKVQAQTVKEGSPVSGYFRCDRVRVFIDDTNTVSRVNSIG